MSDFDPSRRGPRCADCGYLMEPDHRKRKLHCVNADCKTAHRERLQIAGIPFPVQTSLDDFGALPNLPITPTALGGDSWPDIHKAVVSAKTIKFR